MRNGVADIILVAIIGLISSIITVVFEKESNGAITKIIYDSNSTECTKYPKIIFTDE